MNVTGINIFILHDEPALCMLSVQQSSHVLLRSFIISFLHSELHCTGVGMGLGKGDLFYFIIFYFCFLCQYIFLYQLLLFIFKTRFYCLLDFFLFFMFYPFVSRINLFRIHVHNFNNFNHLTIL